VSGAEVSEVSGVSGVQIEDFAAHRELGRVLAEWHVDEFGHLYDADAWNLDVAQREFDDMASDGTLPATWVAFDGEGRGDGDLLGSVSLLPTDDLAGFESLTPWLASLYVVPSARGRGIGSALVQTVLDAARRLGHERVHLFTPDQEPYYLDRGWRTVDRADVGGRHAAVMVRATSSVAARRAVCSHWASDPDTNGAYSYLRAGATQAVRDDLAGPILDGLWFAGEATWRDHPGTLHGAWFSGERAADRIGRVASAIVVGAGLAGLAAARRLEAHGAAVVVLEAADHVGGRAATDVSLGVPLHLGAAWLHGDDGHPLAPLVTSVADEWTDEITHVTDHGIVDGTALDAALAARRRLDAALAAAGADESVAAVLERVLDATPMSALAATVVRGWIRGEYESLYAAPVTDVSARHGAEPYELPGGNRFITSSLRPVVERLAAGLDVHLGHRVGRLTRHDGRWATDTGVTADAVVVAVPIGVLRTGRPAFEPPLPAHVRAAIEQLGAGPVTKLFATYDERWWPRARAIRIAGDAPFVVVVDVGLLTGTPTLCWFAVGDDARRIESMTEDEQCRLVDDTAHRLRLHAPSEPGGPPPENGV
jgi:polyamine oxidase